MKRTTTDLRNTDRLLDAVDALTRDRIIITETETGTHRETHPPLLQLLQEDTGVSGRARSSEISIPIDPDSLELLKSINGTVRLWCTQLNTRHSRNNLPASLRRWYMAHVNLHRAGRISDTTDFDVTKLVEGWVRTITEKFDPPERREWTAACPAMIPVYDDEGVRLANRRCGARRITVAGEERFAIQVNVTTLTAECGKCKTRWLGEVGLSQLRFETNLWEMQQIADKETAQ